MNKDYCVKLELWTTEIRNDGERHLSKRLLELATRYADVDAARVQYARLDIASCWEQRARAEIVALKAIWHEDTCIAFDSYDCDDHARACALADLGIEEPDEVQLPAVYEGAFGKAL